MDKKQECNERKTRWAEMDKVTSQIKNHIADRKLKLSLVVSPFVFDERIHVTEYLKYYKELIKGMESTALCNFARELEVNPGWLRMWSVDIDWFHCSTELGVSKSELE